MAMTDQGGESVCAHLEGSHGAADLPAIAVVQRVAMRPPLVLMGAVQQPWSSGQTEEHIDTSIDSRRSSGLCTVCVGSLNGPFHGCSCGGFHRRRKPTPESCSADITSRALLTKYQCAPHSAFSRAAAWPRVGRFGRPVWRLVGVLPTLPCRHVWGPLWRAGSRLGGKGLLTMLIIRYSPRCSRRVFYSFLLLNGVGILVLSGPVPGGSSWSNQWKSVVLPFRLR